MYGWRARLGILTPSANVVTEPEFELMAPEGVTCHYQKFHFTGGGVEDLKKLEKMVPDAAELISHAGPAAIAMCCTLIWCRGQPKTATRRTKPCMKLTAKTSATVKVTLTFTAARN